ncbi:MAG: glycosyltransferase family 2 protein [Nitrospirales bacterium]
MPMMANIVSAADVLAARLAVCPFFAHFNFNEMNSVVDISVVVPLLNEERYVGHCIESLLSQTYPKDRFEVIVIDNGSQDSSYAIVEQYPQIKLLVESEKGSYAARNRGITEASGSVIAFIDPDCMPDKDWLQNIASAMDEPDVLVLLGRRCLPSLLSSLSLLEAYENEKDEYVINGETETLYYGYTNNMAVRRKLFEDLGLFLKIPRGADTIFVRRVADTYSGGVVRYRSDVVVTHMEVNNVASYYRKAFLYGRHRVLNNTITYAQPLGIRQRLEILRRAILNRGLSMFEAARLLALLAGGGVMWHVGTLSRFGLPFKKEFVAAEDLKET